MTKLRTVIISFLIFLTIFVLTHALKFPGSLAYLMQLTHGQPILDLKASFSSIETYQRLDAFGAAGRQMYLVTMLTIDTVFPLSVFAFLFLLAKYTYQQFEFPKHLKRVLAGIPIIYVLSDFLENAIIAILLTQYPAHWDFLAANIGYITTLKRMMQMAGLFIPLFMLLARGTVSIIRKRKQLFLA